MAAAPKHFLKFKVILHCHLVQQGKPSADNVPPLPYTEEYWLPSPPPPLLLCLGFFPPSSSWSSKLEKKSQTQIQIAFLMQRCPPL